MNIALISPYSDISSLGVRSLAPMLKADGHNVKLIFLPGGATTQLKLKSDFIDEYDRSTMDEVVDICRDADVVGITLMTNYYMKAVQITNAVRRGLDVPVMWGGVHPTLSPGESLQTADIVCVGEGEEAVRELISRMSNGEDYFDTRNFWFRNNGDAVKNPLRPLIQDIDSLPFFDYNLDDDYILDEGHVRKMDMELLKKYLPRPDDINNISRISYKTMATRGCPHNCSYCANYAFRKMYTKQKYLRRRSVDNLITELVNIRERIPEIRIITIADDSFVATTFEQIEEFGRKYKEKVGLPFRCLCSPTTISSEKMEVLIDAGMIEMQMGIQTGSERTRKLYNRSIPIEKTLEGAKILNRYVSRTRPPKYDIILDNPYEDDEDLLDTLDLLLRIPRPFDLTLFSLVFYPGTELFKMATRDKLVRDPVRDIYQKSFLIAEKTYIHLLFHMAEANLPVGFIRFMKTRPMMFIFNRKPLNPLYTGLYKTARNGRIWLKGLKQKLKK